MKLENKSAIVTGAAGGLGKEIAQTFARQGRHR
jgi:NAD(P)-dependent dehydrogenase (short-subunit alcohol dehydrogenase family)